MADENKNRFKRRFSAFDIPETELERMYQQHVIDSKSFEVNEAAFQLAIAREAMMGHGLAFGGTVVPEPSPILGNCIQFTFDTTYGTTAYVDFEVSAETTYTIDWGDGGMEGDIVSFNRSLYHDYAEPDTEYVCTLCFADAGVVTLLDFVGND